MIFPIGDENVKGGQQPFFAYGFIALNVIAFGFQWMDPSGELFTMEYGFIPMEISSGEDYFSLITSMFMHGGFMHLIGNMLFLWIFGDNIEATIGNFKFLMFYILGGLVASFSHIIMDPASTIPCVGASGAISAVMGAYLVMFPRSQIKLIVLLYLRPFYMVAYVFLGFWIIMQLFSGIGALPIFSKEGVDGGGVAYWAHIGGFVFGVMVGLFYKTTSKQNEYDDEFLAPIKAKKISKKTYFKT